MEELWKDLSLPSTPAALQPYHIHSPAATPYRAADVHPQDYLAGPVPLPRGRPYTALSLVSSSAEFTFLRGASSGTPSGSSSCNDYPFGFPSASASGASSSSNKKGKRVQVNAPAAVERQRRMIKNRESAARSRARKQAYTNELEMELAQLRKENKMLIKREQDFISERLATAAQAAVLPDCSSGGGGGRSRSSGSTLHFELEQRQRCRSAPAP